MNLDKINLPIYYIDTCETWILHIIFQWKESDNLKLRVFSHLEKVHYCTQREKNHILYKFHNYFTQKIFIINITSSLFGLFLKFNLFFLQLVAIANSKQIYQIMIDLIHAQNKQNSPP